jgi:hypothetical protein
MTMMATTHASLAPLTKEEKAKLDATEGCRKCRRIYVYHHSVECPYYRFLIASSYHGLIDNCTTAALATTNPTPATNANTTQLRVMHPVATVGLWAAEQATFGNGALSALGNRSESEEGDDGMVCTPLKCHHLWWQGKN